MVDIDAARLLASLNEIRQFGAYKTGVHRPTLSTQDMAARRWLVEQLEAIGHTATIDGLANVLGRAPGAGPHVLAGSHVESQNHAGWLDGALGVIYALEAARAIKESGQFAGRGVDVIGFSDEEGHFGSYLGSYSFLGELDESTIDAARDRTHGRAMREMLAEAGLAGVPRMVYEPGRYSAFLEAHIEQGDSLEASGLGIGVVTSVVAIWLYRIVFTGEQNHAGTTRMATRKDAGAALTRFCCRIAEAFPAAAGPRSVWTTGRITLEPGAPNIIPGRAEMLFHFRDSELETLQRLQETLRGLVAEANAEGPCGVELEVVSQSKPAKMDEGVQAAVERAAERHAPGRHVRMPSGAGHDAQNMARHMPSGMLFVPSIDGISHHWTENTSDEDLVLGARVYADALAELLAKG